MTISTTSAGFEIRQQNFGGVMDFYAPGLKQWSTSEWTPSNPKQFLPISVTGSACALSCDHCQTKVLDGMAGIPEGETLFDTAVRLKAQGSKGLLVSGGSTRTGGVPLRPHLEHVPRIREELGMSVIVHSGVVSPALARQLADAGVDGVMLDIIGADETIRDVYHLPLTTKDFDESLRVLSDNGLRIIPHIILGSALRHVPRRAPSPGDGLLLQRQHSDPRGPGPADRHPDGPPATAAHRGCRRVLRHRP